MKRVLSLSLPTLLVLSVVAAADDPKPGGGKSVPPGVPLEVKVIAKKDTYTLDLGGKKPEEFREMIKKAQDQLPAAPAVDLEVVVTNTSDKEQTFWFKGDPVVLTLDLQGKGAVTAQGRGAFTTDFRLPESMTLAPGKTHTIPVKSLAFGFRGASQFAFFTEPGEYTLAASLKTGVKPIPQGAKDNGEGFGEVVLTSAPVKLKVEAK